MDKQATVDIEGYKQCLWCFNCVLWSEMLT